MLGCIRCEYLFFIGNWLMKQSSEHVGAHDLNNEMNKNLKALSALINVIVMNEGLYGFRGDIVSAYLSLIKEKLDKVLTTYNEILKGMK